MILQIFTMSLIAFILLVLKISIFLSVLALGLKASFADATFFLQRPREIGRAFLAMNLLMPVVAFLLAVTLDLNPAVKIALVTVSVSPVPPVFPKKALKIGCKEKPLVRPISGLENWPAQWRQRSPDDEWRLRGPRRYGFPDQVLRGNARSKDQLLRTGRN